jgi:hypothetical protein
MPNKIGNQIERLRRGKVDCIMVVVSFASPTYLANDGNGMK